MKAARRGRWSGGLNRVLDRDHGSRSGRAPVAPRRAGGGGGVPRRAAGVGQAAIGRGDDPPDPRLLIRAPRLAEEGAGSGRVRRAAQLVVLPASSFCGLSSGSVSRVGSSPAAELAVLLGEWPASVRAGGLGGACGGGDAWASWVAVVQSPSAPGRHRERSFIGPLRGPDDRRGRPAG